MDFRIRPASSSDAESLAHVHVVCWREAYAGVLSAGFLASLSVPSRTARWRRIFADTRPEHIIVAAEAEGEIVGFASSGRCRDRDRPRMHELYSIYLLAAHYGSGIGQRMLDATLSTGPAVLWVAEKNPRARAFYRRNEFAADGRRKVERAWENLAEIRMIR